MIVIVFLVIALVFMVIFDEMMAEKEKAEQEKTKEAKMSEPTVTPGHIHLDMKPNATELLALLIEKSNKQKAAGLEDAVKRIQAFYEKGGRRLGIEIRGFPIANGPKLFVRVSTGIDNPKGLVILKFTEDNGGMRTLLNTDELFGEIPWEFARQDNFHQWWKKRVRAWLIGDMMVCSHPHWDYSKPLEMYYGEVEVELTAGLTHGNPVYNEVCPLNVTLNRVPESVLVNINVCASFHHTDSHKPPVYRETDQATQQVHEG